MKKVPFTQKVLWVFVIVLVPIMFYLIIDVGSAGEIFKLYESMKPDSSSNYSKSMIFLSSYTRETGDTSLAVSVGIPEDEVWSVLPNGDQSTPFNNHFNSQAFDEQVRLLKEDRSYNNSYYSTMLIVKEVDGVKYAYENQTTGAWTSYSPGSSSMSGYGCFYYASAALVGAEKGSVYTIEQLLTDLGGTVTVNSNGSFVVNPSPISNLNGSIGQLNTILNAAGTGKSASVVNSIDESKLASGTMYIIYATAAAGSSTNLYNPNSAGMHWTAVVGVSGNDYIVLGNGGRGHLINKTEFYSLAHIFEVN